MTVLTALRTAATAALATDLLARKNAKVFAIIGTGAQSEFQAKAVQLVRDIEEIRFFDIDEHAMNKFAKNMGRTNVRSVRCSSAKMAVESADIITVCTAAKANVEVVKNEWIQNGMHINALGGDTVGKTELALSILSRAKIFVEYFEQSYIEGEIQKLEKVEAKNKVAAELHEIITEKKKGRTSNNEITLFDSVGIALEDYSVLRLVYTLMEQYKIGDEFEIIPQTSNPKDLFSVL